MTDVDNFHLLNDYWGYETGTNILNFILKKLELFPQTLFVNRYHSDIFVGIIDITWQDPAVVREKISAYHKQAIRFFHDRNIRISMDDFGSGYSSLNMLTEIPVDVLKLDMRFLEGYSAGKAKGNILEFSVGLAKSLGLESVAEGVETREMVDELKRLNCEMGQGYYFSRPIPIHEFEQKFDKNQKQVVSA